MSQMNPKKIVHNTAYSVQPPVTPFNPQYIAVTPFNQLVTSYYEPSQGSSLGT